MELNKKTMLRGFLFVAAGIVLYWLLNEMDKVSGILKGVGAIFSPFVTGSIIAFILNVPTRAFERLLKRVKNKSFRRISAIILTVIAVLLVLTLVCLLLIPQLMITLLQLGPSLGGLADDVVKFAKDTLAQQPQIYDWVVNNVDLDNVDWGSLLQNAVPILGNGVSSIVNYIFGMISALASGVVNAFLAIVFAIYCLFNKESLARQGRKVLYAFFPEKFCDRVIRVLRLSNATFSNFLSGQCVEACILGSLFAVAMSIFRMPYIPLICVLIAVTAFIPIVGALIGCFVGAFLIAVMNPIQAIYFIIMSVILQQLENNLIYPRVVGTSIGLPGMWVLVAVSVGGAIMGVGGMFLMIPLSSVLYTVFKEATNKRLDNRQIDEEKLRYHPPVLNNRRMKNTSKKKPKDDQTDDGK